MELQHSIIKKKPKICPVLYVGLFCTIQFMCSTFNNEVIYSTNSCEHVLCGRGCAGSGDLVENTSDRISHLIELACYTGCQRCKMNKALSPHPQIAHNQYYILTLYLLASLFSVTLQKILISKLMHFRSC